MAQYVGVHRCDECSRYRACVKFSEGSRLCQECLEAAAELIAARQDDEAARDAAKS